MYSCTINQKEDHEGDNRRHAILFKNSQFKTIRLSYLAGHLDDEIKELWELAIEDVITEELEINHCKVGELRIINKSNSIDKLVIKGGDIRRIILEGDFKECIIGGVNVSESIEIKGQYKQITISGKSKDTIEDGHNAEAYIACFTVNTYSQPNKGSLLIDQANIGTLQFDGIHNGSVTIRHTKTKTCCFSDFTNSG